MNYGSSDDEEQAIKNDLGSYSDESNTRKSSTNPIYV